MKSDAWNAVEQILDRYGVKPLVAVVPDNKDDDLKLEKVDLHFWDKVKGWQEKGWGVALHGCEHKLDKRNSGLLKINVQSEFAGLSIEEQTEKIRKGLSIFDAYGIRPLAFVAPAHSFDENTLKALKQIGKLLVISDGFSFFPYTCNGIVWIPQQLSQFKRRLFGVWTICLHPNSMKESDIHSLEKLMKRNFAKFTSIEEVLSCNNKRKINLVEKMYWAYKVVKINGIKLIRLY